MGFRFHGGGLLGVLIVLVLLGLILRGLGFMY